MATLITNSLNFCSTSFGCFVLNDIELLLSTIGVGFLFVLTYLVGLEVAKEGGLKVHKFSWITAIILTGVRVWVDCLGF